MNVYEKLAKARLMFQESKPKMSGKNAYAGYTYFELSDILPVVNKIGAEIGFVCEVSFTMTEAVLTFRNTEKAEEAVCFTSPMSTASLKGCHEVQNLGAVQTYLKRYLYQNAFEIVEADSLNATHMAQKPSEAKPSEAKTRCTQLGDKLGITQDERKRLFEESGRNYEKLEAVLEARLEAKDTEKQMDIF